MFGSQPDSLALIVRHSSTSSVRAGRVCASQSVQNREEGMGTTRHQDHPFVRTTVLSVLCFETYCSLIQQEVIVPFSSSLPLPPSLSSSSSLSSFPSLSSPDLLFPLSPFYLPHTHLPPPTTLRGIFTMEYCGEVCTPGDFELRKKEYVKDKRRHYYFMSLKTDQVTKPLLVQLLPLKPDL